MYATSKLIIPAKIAQDSPYVPKIRIRLRRSPSLHTTSDMGSPVGSDGLLNKSHHSIVFSATGTTPVLATSEVETQFAANNEDQVYTVIQQSRPNRKRKIICPYENIDLERRDSVLTKVNLKRIINMESFDLLPPESKRLILDLLPAYDRVLPATESNDASHIATTPCWIHPTALNNEFLTKALHDYSLRQMNGDFDPRCNFRTGLRKSVGNRQRYAATDATEPVALPRLPPYGTKDGSTLPSVSATPSAASSFNVAMVSPSNSLPPNVSSQTAASPGSAYHNAPYRRPAHRYRNRSLSSAPEGQNEIASVGSVCMPTQKHCASAVPTANSIISNGSSPMIFLKRTVSRPSAISKPMPSSPLSYRRMSMPKLKSTLSMSDGGTNLESSRGMAPVVPRSRNNHPPLFASDAHQQKPTCRNSLVVNSSSPHTSSSAISPSVMPPPRETKTLASVREKLRAKRLMLAGTTPNPHQSSPLSPVLPHGSTHSNHQTLPLSQYQTPNISGGSLTPNPGASYSGDFYSVPIAASKKSSPTAAAISLNCPLPLISDDLHPPVNSASAPATPRPHHLGGSVGAVGPIPAILANFKHARVVVAPSRSVSGSSVSSGEGGSDPIAEQESVNQVQDPPVPVPVLQNGCATTRAYLVDGTALSETLAFFQSINPKARVTQQQFLLITGTNKSHAILCRTSPIPIQPKQPIQTQPLARQASTMSPSLLQSPRKQSIPSPSSAMFPLILPASRSQHEQHPPLSVSGQYREILPNITATRSQQNKMLSHQSHLVSPSGSFSGVAPQHVTQQQIPQSQSVSSQPHHHHQAILPHPHPPHPPHPG